MYTRVNIHKKGDSISCIAHWNTGGLFRQPKGHLFELMQPAMRSDSGNRSRDLIKFQLHEAG